MESDLEIAQRVTLKPIWQIAESIGLSDEDLFPYGKYKAKVSLDVMKRVSRAPLGKYIDVTALTPTPLGEGKTVTTVGLGLALNKIGKRAVVCLRQPSMGPTFGIKGGAAGGGYAQVVPMEEFNLHLTGDIHAVGIAHNLLAALIDNHIHHGNALGFDIREISWRRVVDVSDRALRNIVTGLGGKAHGVCRETGFDITVASELMAILALTSGIQDLRQRIGRVVVGRSAEGRPITAEELQAAGAMTVLLKEAIMPTLMQTTENTPVFVHTGPFANIAHGNSSILADQIALRLADYVVTESGFGADMGFEKFANIKCRYSGLKPDAAVLVASVRALKVHSGQFVVKAGKPLDPALTAENPEAVRKGAGNLVKQIENVRMHGVPVVVAINRFPTDTEKELSLLKELSLEAGAAAAEVSEVHQHGGEGGVALAEKVIDVAEHAIKEFRHLYPLKASIKEKIHTIATHMYGAEGVTFDALAEKQIAWLTEHGFSDLPICMAKTQLSLSHDPGLKGRPVGFKVPVREVRASIGAGFLVPVCGDMMLMPGLPSHPAAARVDIDAEGRTVGLF
ncbi:MAG TPA: formate--tetrahydrofolate ligase [Candidatus Hydrogenedentes bacterium]|nr:formate--tetrahydrofolate ligase [Candidatus Hydrogenedentota bacterium]HOL75597.1 formate--tetrahydrofolate ligase [Candidatus Hydrogenedentota bacterium]HPO84410.1 formate--tetrahydrofolate ligase [Candidatus Hydrogenedentota bacterium]